MRKLSALLLALAALPLLSACDSGDDGPDHAGSLVIHASLTPTPAQVGDHVLHLHIVDADGNDVDGATVHVTPWMEIHGHGSPKTPAVEAHGGGAYTAAPITFNMPGPWEVRIHVEADGEHGAETLQIQVGG